MRAVKPLFLASSALILTTANAAAEPAGAMIEEILVSASKREQRLIDVPYAVTAVTGAEIANRGSLDIKDLQYSIPGLNITQFQPGADKIQMRGIDPGGGTGLPIVGVYVDEVGISIDQQQRDGNFPLVDIERVEVLRGPQGTLYGQGSVAGTIRYLTKDPSLTEVSGFVEANAYHQEKGDMGYNMTGAVGVPLVQEKVGLRMVAGFKQQSGWIDYPNINQKDVNDAETYFMRGKLLAQPSDRLKISLLYQYLDQQFDSDGHTGLVNVGVNPFRNQLSPVSDESHLANAIIEYDFGPVTFLSSTGYQHRQFAVDLDFSPAPFTLIADTTYKQLSQEVRLASSDDAAPLTYIVGAWYRDFKSQVQRSGTLFGGPFPALQLDGDDPVDSKSYAVFGDATWKATDQLEASVGLRYYWDKRRQTGVNFFGPLPLFKDKFNSFSPRVNLLYRVDEDFSTYATVSKGFRSGGFNSNGSTFDAESLWNYELGAKSSLLDGRMFADLAVYYLDYKNRQAQSTEIINGVPFAITGNGGKASGLGVEFGMTSILTEGLTFDVTMSYTDVKYDNTTKQVSKGDRFNFVPAFSGSASLMHRFELANALGGFWRIDYQHADGVRSIIRDNDIAPNFALEDLKTAPQDLVNLRIGVETENVTLTFDVYNLLGESAIVFPFTFISANQQAVRVRPRSYGVTLRYNF